MINPTKIKTVGLCLTFAALAAASSASAETIYLSCQGDGEATARTVTVDLTNKTVDNHPSSIDATSIDWNWVLGSADGRTSGVVYAHIDRVSGAYTWRIAYTYDGRPNGEGHTHGNCRVGEAPQTKF